MRPSGLNLVIFHSAESHCTRLAGQRVEVDELTMFEQSPRRFTRPNTTIHVGVSRHSWWHSDEHKVAQLLQFPWTQYTTARASRYLATDTTFPGALVFH